MIYIITIYRIINNHIKQMVRHNIVVLVSIQHNYNYNYLMSVVFYLVSFEDINTNI